MKCCCHLAPNQLPGGFISTPATLTDFSMFPNSLPPSQGLWIAMDENWLYTFKFSETSWQQTARAI